MLLLLTKMRIRMVTEISHHKQLLMCDCLTPSKIHIGHNDVAILLLILSLSLHDRFTNDTLATSHPQFIDNNNENHI